MSESPERPGVPELRDLLAADLPALQAFVRLHMHPAMREQESCVDIAQSVCRELLEKEPDFEWRGRQAFRRFLYTWARNKMRDRARYYTADRRRADLGRAAEAGDEWVDLFGITPSQEAMSREERQKLDQALDQLTTDERDVLAFCHLAGLTREQAADVLGLTPAAVGSRLHRAKLRLSELLVRMGLD